jgi:type I restriction enzyme S subunit
MSFSSYGNYKDTNVAELGEVPAHWNVVPLKHVVETPITDGPHETPEFIDDGIPFVSAEAVSSGEINFSKSRFISHADHHKYSKKYKPRRDDIFMVKSGATTGVVALVSTDRDFNIWSPLAVVRCSRLAFPRYVLQTMRSRNFQESVILNWSFGTQQNIGMSVIENLRIPLPPIPEQNQIARFLDHETARIDALIEEQQRLIELLKEKRQGVISLAVTKGLDPTVPMKDSGVEWLGEVPAHWVVGPLRWYATIQGGIAKGKDYEGRETVSLPYLRVANVQNGFVDLTEVKEISVLESEVERYSLRLGDVLMNEGGDNDKLGRGTVWQRQIEPCLHQNHVFAIRPNELLSAEWLTAFTQCDQARSYFFLNSKQSTN